MCCDGYLSQSQAVVLTFFNHQCEYQLWYSNRNTFLPFPSFPTSLIAQQAFKYLSIIAYEL